MNTTIPKRQPLEWCFFGIILFSHPFLRPEALNFLFQSILFLILLRFAYQPIQ